MVVLGLDLASKVCGWGKVNLDTNGTRTYLDSGVIDITKLKLKTEPRLYKMGQELDKLITEIHPDYIWLEQIYLGANVDVFKTLAQLQGIIIGLSFSKWLIPFSFIEPNSWRKEMGITTSKKERDLQKAQSIQIVKDLFKLETTSDDRAEGSLIAYSGAGLLKDFDFSKL